MIYNEDSMLNSQNITVEGIGNTVQLICVGSNTNQTDSIMVRYQTTTLYHNLVCYFRLNLLNYLKRMDNSNRFIHIFNGIVLPESI